MPYNLKKIDVLQWTGLWKTQIWNCSRFSITASSDISPYPQIILLHRFLAPQWSPQPHQTPNALIGSFVWTVTPTAQTPAPLLMGAAVFSSCFPLFLSISTSAPSSLSLSSLICVSISHGGSAPIPLRCSPLCLHTHKCRHKHAPNFKPLLSASFYDYSLPFPNSLSFSISPHLPPSGSRGTSNGFFWQI